MPWGTFIPILICYIFYRASAYSKDSSRGKKSWAINSKGFTPSEGVKWDWGRKNSQFSANKLPYLRNGARWDKSYYKWPTGSRIRPFDWCQNQRRWMTLNGRYTLCCIFWSLHKNLNEDRPIQSAAKVRPMNQVSGGIRFVRKFAGVPRK